MCACFGKDLESPYGKICAFACKTNLLCGSLCLFMWVCFIVCVVIFWLLSAFVATTFIVELHVLSVSVWFSACAYLCDSARQWKMWAMIKQYVKVPLRPLSTVWKKWTLPSPEDLTCNLLLFMAEKSWDMTFFTVYIYH